MTKKIYGGFAPEPPPGLRPGPVNWLRQVSKSSNKIHNKVKFKI
jgi:hypothetical protein